MNNILFLCSMHYFKTVAWSLETVIIINEKKPSRNKDTFIKESECLNNITIKTDR